MYCIFVSRMKLMCRIGGNDVVGVFIVDKTGEVVAGTTPLFLIVSNFVAYNFSKGRCE